MDIKEIALKVAQATNLHYIVTSEKHTNDDWNIRFAESLISAYKAELLKEVGEPVGYHYLPNNEMFPVEEVSRSNLKNNPQDYVFLYTSDQVAAAILKATKLLEEEVERLKKHQCAPVCIFHEGDEREELKKQLAAAQEENGRLENQVLARDAELWGRTQEILGLKDQLAKANQLWQIAQGRCDGLEEKLAKAEQRVAEYNELIYAVQTKHHDETRHQTALRYIRNAENRPSNAVANGASS